MSDELKTRYAIIFLGPAQNTIEDVNKVAYGLQSRFNLSSEAVTKVMRMAPVAIKKDLTAADAQRYKEVLESIGARVRLEAISHEKDEHEEYQPDLPSLDKKSQTIALQKRASSPAPDTPPPKAAEQKQTMTQCPQCGFVQAVTDECIKCGVIISKFLKYQEEIKTIGDQKPLQALDIKPLLEEEVGTTPWEDMAYLGFFKGFFRTMKEVLFSPTAFFRNMPVSKGMGSPLLYGVIISFLGTTIGLLEQYAFSGFIRGFTPVEEGMEGAGVSFFQTAFLLIYAFFLPILIAIGFFIMSAIFHVCLMIVGAGKRGFEATFRVLAYTSSTQVFALIPFLGGLIIAIYNLVLWTIGFKESHRTTTGRALIAVLLPMIVLGVFIVLVVIAVLIPLLASLPQTMQQQPPSF